LLAAALVADPLRARRRSASAPAAPPLQLNTQGCPYAARCPRVQEQCRVERPLLRTLDESQLACHFPAD
jgi:ABC-type antimicrobial peptide transport system ATPase subunit